MALRSLLLICCLALAVLGHHRRADEGSTEEQQDMDWQAEEGAQKILSMCSVCKTVMKMVKKKISPNSSTSDIKTRLDKACERSGPLKTKCKSFVQKHVKLLLDELRSEDGPQTICAKLRLCKSDPHPGEFADHQAFGLF